MVYDLIIAGSGPAGLTAAIYAKRAGLSFVVLEKENMSGGQVLNTYEVDNYPGLPGIGGFELGMKMREHADRLGVSIINIEVRHLDIEEEGRIKAIYTDSEVYRARSVIFAMGAKHRLLDVPGEKELTGMGVSYCATCDGAFFKGRTVAVIGGGDAAAEDAIYLAKGCEHVYVIHRRNTMRAAAILQDQLKSCENVTFLWDTEITRIVGVYNSVLPSNARSSVTSSMYSKSPPTGTPLAIRLTLIPVGLINLLMYIAVVSPSRLEFVAIMTSSTSFCRRSINSFSLISPGPIPSIGEIAP